MEKEGVFEVLPKKEVVTMKREMQRLQKLYKGIIDMDRIPDIIWVVDTNREHIAVTEARRLGVKVVAIADSNCDPDEIDYLIPGNDDAIKSIKLLTSRIADAVLDGKQRREASAVSETSKRKVVVVAEEEKELFERAMAMSEKYEDIDKDSVDY
jgi:ribosomal protein S2, bacterial type